MAITSLVRQSARALLSGTLLLVFVQIAQAEQWRKLPYKLGGDLDFCLDLDSIRPGPENYTQFRSKVCDIDNVQTEAIDCRVVDAVVRAGRAGFIPHMKYDPDSRQWYKIAPIPADSFGGYIAEEVCDARTRR